jgi:hypothetical protein
MKLRVVHACLLLVPLSVFIGFAQKPGGTAGKPQQRATSSSRAPSTDEGGLVFKANCSRCHAAPMSFTPRSTGTVIMHMRVRARLSQQDEQALLKFIAP